MVLICVPGYIFIVSNCGLVSLHVVSNISSLSGTS